MRFREIYTSRFMIVGLVCVVLGVGNWTVGTIESGKYQALLRKTTQTGLEETYRSFRELDQQKNEEVLRPINEDREKYNAARVKLNFFYIVLTGGRLLFAIGTILLLSTAIRMIRRDAQMKISKVASSTQ